MYNETLNQQCLTYDFNNCNYFFEWQCNSGPPLAKHLGRHLTLNMQTVLLKSKFSLCKVLLYCIHSSAILICHCHEQMLVEQLFCVVTKHRA